MGKGHFYTQLKDTAAGDGHSVVVNQLSDNLLIAGTGFYTEMMRIR